MAYELFDNITNKKIDQIILDNYDDIRSLVTKYSLIELKKEFDNFKRKKLVKSLNLCFEDQKLNLNAETLNVIKLKTSLSEIDYLMDFETKVQFNEIKMSINYDGLRSGSLDSCRVTIDGQIYDKYHENYIASLKKVSQLFIDDMTNDQLKRFHRALLDFMLENSSYPFEYETFSI